MHILITFESLECRLNSLVQGDSRESVQCLFWRLWSDTMRKRTRITQEAFFFIHSFYAESHPHCKFCERWNLFWNKCSDGCCILIISLIFQEHVGKAADLRKETGLLDSRKDEVTENPGRAWNQSEYLKQRLHQLEPVMNSLDPIKPVRLTCIVIYITIFLLFFVGQPNHPSRNSIILIWNTADILKKALPGPCL